MKPLKLPNMPETWVQDGYRGLAYEGDIHWWGVPCWVAEEPFVGHRCERNTKEEAIAAVVRLCKLQPDSYPASERIRVYEEAVRVAKPCLLCRLLRLMGSFLRFVEPQP